MHYRSASIAVISVAFGLGVLALFGIRQYDWNLSALLHMDVTFGETHAVPPGVILYQDGGYDGMLYYQVARDLPAFFRGEELLLDSPYRFQRILLPLLAFGLAFGHEDALPSAMFAVNVLAILGTLAALIVATERASVHALAGVLNPATLVGMLYALTEPLSMFFLAIFLSRWLFLGRKSDRLCVLALTLSIFARETTVFLIPLLMFWHVWRREWRQVFMLTIPFILFALWQVLLTFIAGSVPIETGGNMIGPPFVGPFMAIRWAFEDVGLRQAYRLSSLALLAFVAGVCGALFADRGRACKERDPLWISLFGLTVVMLCMHSHIWGAITSIGRVVTPFYPVYALYAASRDTPALRFLSSFLIVLSIVAAIGVAAVRHPYILS